MDDINRFLKTLRGQERTCAGICADQTCTKQDLLELVQLQIQASLTPQVHQFLLRFLQNVQSQMTSQYEIYRCEVEIGNRFIRSLREAVLFLSYQEHVDYHSKFLKILSKLYRVLKKVRLDTLPSIPQENFQTIDQALEKYESHIQQRRDQYQAIQKAVKRLQSITRYVETLDPNSILNQKPTASRMAFIQKHHKI
ncbi:hypothetical protein GF373_06400 [bacterium]|nr:hypothetical protein [bacterium]